MTKQKKEKIIFTTLLVLLAISIPIVLASFLGPIEVIWPGNDSISKAVKDLQNAQTELQAKITQLEERRLSRRKIFHEAYSFWISSRDGQIDTILLQNLENMAKNSNITINHIGNNKISKVNEFFSFFDFTIEAQGSMEDIAKFIVEIYKTKPKLHWTRCILRPQRPTDSRDLALSAALRVVLVDDNKLAEKIIEGSQR